ncbi:hypothetical protein D1872_264120 [compost metagenome]
MFLTMYCDFCLSFLQEPQIVIMMHLVLDPALAMLRFPKGAHTNSDQLGELIKHSHARDLIIHEYFPFTL